LCGRWHKPFGGDPYPHYFITQEQWDLWRRHCEGEKDLQYENETFRRGQPFEPKHIYANLLRVGHIKDMIAGSAKYYGTGGVFGFAWFMADEDAHNGEPDLAELHQDMVEDLGSDFFFVPSTRGNNLHFKIDYRSHGVEEYREALGKLDHLVKELAQLRGRQAVPEIKAKPGNRTYYGTLAKLPCFGNWSEERLEEWLRLPVKTFAWLEKTIERLETKVLCLRGADLMNMVLVPVVESTEQPSGTEPEPASAPVKKERTQKGSCLGVAVPEEELERLAEAVRCYKNNGMADRLYAMRPECGCKDVLVTRTDCAEGLAVMSLCGAYLKNGNEFPQQFAKRLTKIAYEGAS
jgi:hypothetical protein